MPVVSIKQAVNALKQGKIIAYPTEAVYGLGCDPKNELALKKIIQLKQRSPTKGLIVVGGKFAHIAPYITWKEKELPKEIKKSWPGPHNWLLPANIANSNLLTGNHSTQAIRLSAHPVIQNLCALFQNGLVSTSANKTNQPPCRTQEELIFSFGAELTIVEGKLGESLLPCNIKHHSSNKIIR